MVHPDQAGFLCCGIGGLGHRRHLILVKHEWI
jgi:hypothetical protein